MVWRNIITKEITDSILELGRKGERVLALTELVLDKKFYDVSIPEPENFKDQAGRKPLVP